MLDLTGFRGQMTFDRFCEAIKEREAWYHNIPEVEVKMNPAQVLSIVRELPMRKSPVPLEPAREAEALGMIPGIVEEGVTLCGHPLAI